jgi:hypothetical protein
LSLARIRNALGQTWLIATFGVVYAVSQLTIARILAPLGASIAELQLTGFTAEVYRRVFTDWAAAGLLDTYRAHFVFDDVHWVWYAGLFTTLLCRLFERHRIAHRWDWVLLLPLASGLMDAYENRLQHLFLLGGPPFEQIADPLPLLSTLASLGKWTLAASYVALTAALLSRSGRRMNRRTP